MEGSNSRRRRALCSSIAGLAALLLAAGAPGLALSQGLAQPPARIGNHYDHKAYQPNQAEVCADPRADRLNCSSRTGTQAEEKLKSIQRELDELDKKYPPGRALNGTSDR